MEGGGALPCVDWCGHWCRVLAPVPTFQHYPETDRD